MPRGRGKFSRFDKVPPGKGGPRVNRPEIDTGTEELRAKDPNRPPPMPPGANFGTHRLVNGTWVRKNPVRT